MAAISNDHQTIGLNIQKLRDQQNMARVDLAAALGVSKNTVVSIENGESDFGISKLISACDTFDVAPSEILPDRMKPESDLDQDMRKLAERLSRLKPYQRSQCLTALYGMVDAFTNATQ